MKTPKIASLIHLPEATRKAIAEVWPEPLVIDNSGRLSFHETCPGHAALWRAAEQLVSDGVLVRRAIVDNVRWYRLSNAALEIDE